MPASHLPAKPTRIVDLVGRPVLVQVLSAYPSPSDEFACTLVYATRSWVGVSWLYRGRVHYEHYPLSAIKRIKTIERARRPRP